MITKRTEFNERPRSFSSAQVAWDHFLVEGEIKRLRLDADNNLIICEHASGRISQLSMDQAALMRASLTAQKPTRRETAVQVRVGGKMRNLILEAHGHLLTIRAKGSQEFYTISYEQAWNLGARNAAEQTRQERAQGRELRKVAR